MLDSSDEDDDTAGSVACAIGNAVAPAGYKIIEECPPLTNELQKNEIIGKTVLYGWDSKKATGWFVGTVHSRSPSEADLKKAPTANFVVKYTAKITEGSINGNVACELSARTHGPGEWWVLVEKDATPAVGSAGSKGKGKGKGESKVSPTHLAVAADGEGQGDQLSGLQKIPECTAQMCVQSQGSIPGLALCAY